LKLIDGEMVDVANVAHFMEQMLTKTREFLSCNARVEGCASIELFTSQVKKIFEEHSSRVK
uniref:Rrf2 family transcriptional regulator n=1 Tax=Heligmosomoides polygyrus TaxID=6339 RepID=A0A183GKK9_HELPZ